MIAYERVGAGEPLLLVHGLGSDRHIWRPVLAPLALERDVIAVDLPGFGDSELSGGAPTPHALAVSVASLLDELGIETAHVAGNSLGGWVAVELARLGRARSLVLISPAGLWRGTAPWLSRFMLRANRTLASRVPDLSPVLRTRVGRTALLWQFFGRPWRVPAADAILASRSFGTCPGFWPTYRELRNRRITDARDLGVPVTVTFGSRDWLLPRGSARYPAELPPVLRHPALPGCGHTPTYDDPELVAEIILTGTSLPTGS